MLIQSFRFVKALLDSMFRTYDAHTHWTWLAGFAWRHFDAVQAWRDKTQNTTRQILLFSIVRSGSSFAEQKCVWLGVCRFVKNVKREQLKKWRLFMKLQQFSAKRAIADKNAWGWIWSLTQRCFSERVWMKRCPSDWIAIIPVFTTPV